MGGEIKIIFSIYSLKSFACVCMGVFVFKLDIHKLKREKEG